MIGEITIIISLVENSNDTLEAEINTYHLTPRSKGPLLHSSGAGHSRFYLSTAGVFPFRLWYIWYG